MRYDGISSIPKYDQVQYWNDRYANDDNEMYFDWLLSFSDVCHIIRKVISPKDEILCVGCGNSPMPIEMYDAGFTNQVCIDNSGAVITKMRDCESAKRPEIEWRCMDATKTSFLDGTFDVVVDKGLLDCLLCGEADEERFVLCQETPLSSAYVSEVFRLLRSVRIRVIQSEVEPLDLGRIRSCLYGGVLCAAQHNSQVTT